jgi:hypothetical protein
MVMLGGKRDEDGSERHTREENAEDNRKPTPTTRTVKGKTAEDLSDDIPF